MTNKEQTGKASASRAAKVLRDPSASAAAKSAAGSTLTQRGTQVEQTSRAAATQASHILRDPSATAREKSAAASALTQRANRR
ncbi:MAG: hypothetical protein Q8J81_13840 [Phenylobacterium sp.]|nr:hypothetical protein [Phenylobacterium sp.]